MENKETLDQKLENICIQTGLPCGMQCLSEEACNSIRLKQETLEEAAERLYPEVYRQFERMLFIKGAKWQQEPEQFFNDDRVKTLEKGMEYLLKKQERTYSEEEVLEFTQTIIQQYKLGNTNIEQLDLLKETLEQFKNK